MFRTGMRAAAVELAWAIFAASVFSSPASADFNGKFPGKGNVKAWQSAVENNLQALAAVQRGDTQAAESLFRKSIKVYPYDPSPLFNLGLLLKRESRYKEAEPLLLRSIELQPVFENWATLGTVFQHEGKFQLAERAFVEAAKLTKTQAQREALSEQIKQLRQHNGK